MWTAGSFSSRSNQRTSAVRITVFWVCPFTFTVGQLSQPSLTRCTLPGSYKVLLSSGRPTFLTLHSTPLYFSTLSFRKDPFAIPSQPISSSTSNMGKAADAPAGGQKMIPADCVSVLLMAIGCTSISREQLNMMSALDGTRTASSFEHQFRSISAKAKELKKRVDDGEVFTPVTAQKRGVQWLLRQCYPESSIADNGQVRPHLSLQRRGRATTTTTRLAKSRRLPPSSEARRPSLKLKLLQHLNLLTTMTMTCPPIWPTSSRTRNSGKKYSLSKLDTYRHRHLSWARKQTSLVKDDMATPVERSFLLLASVYVVSAGLLLPGSRHLYGVYLLLALQEGKC